MKLLHERVKYNNQLRNIFLPRLRKVGKTYTPRKNEGKLTFPPITMKAKLQHYKLYGVEGFHINKGELQLVSEAPKEQKSYNNGSMASLHPRSIKILCYTTRSK